MSESLCRLTPGDFVTWAVEQIRDGYGMVPFIGCGVSADSGILTGQQFMGYITWTVYRCVAEPDSSRHNLHQSGWPAFPTEAEQRKARDWVWKVFERTCSDCGLVAIPLGDEERCVGYIAPAHQDASGGALPLEAALRRPLVPSVLRHAGTSVNDDALRGLLQTLRCDESPLDFRGNPGTSPTSLHHLEECAIRALSDWRASLEFLARLKLDGPDRLFLEEQADQAIIDGFNLHITRGRRPNFNHAMICHLATKARFRTILTTNFDNLLEDAFTQLGEPYVVFPVSLNGKLPSEDSVHAQNCIVKLHGDLSETRANLSLDAPASEIDKRRFFHYVRGKFPEQNATDGFLPSHLLVCGYSGSDMRCVQMVKFVLDMDPDAQVFWVCHSEADLRTVHKHFQKEEYQIATNLDSLRERVHGKKGRRGRVVATVTARVDLLLLELYQKLALTLPRGGFSFPLSQSLPPARSASAITAPEQDSISQAASDLVKAVLEPREQNSLVIADGETGLSEPLGYAFQQLMRQGLRGIWVDLDYFADARAVAHQIFQEISLQLGRFQRDHARLLPESARSPGSKILWGPHITWLLRYWHIDPADWLIVLNGRNGPGSAAGWEREVASWNCETYAEFHRLVQALVDRSKSPDQMVQSSDAKASAIRQPRGFNVIYAPYTSRRHERDMQKKRWLDVRTKILDAEECPVGARSEWCAAGKGECWPEQVADFNQVLGALDRSVGRQVVNVLEDTGPDFERCVETTLTSWIQNRRCVPDRRSARRQRLLYAVSLFRYSRHISAFASEAVYPLSNEFSIRFVPNAGLDNDWIRALDIVDWLRELKQHPNVFLDLPGEYAWMYRDTRDAIQLLSEHGQQWGTTGWHDQSPIEYRPALSDRARMHFWIGDWYRRAFCITGHVMPLLEALYHFSQCVIHADKSLPYIHVPFGRKPLLIRLHRERLAKHAIFEMIKSLRMGRSAIEFWVQEGAGDAWFGETALAHLERRMGEVLDRIGQELTDFVSGRKLVLEVEARCGDANEVEIHEIKRERLVWKPVLRISPLHDRSAREWLKPLIDELRQCGPGIRCSKRDDSDTVIHDKTSVSDVEGPCCTVFHSLEMPSLAGDPEAWWSVLQQAVQRSLDHHPDAAARAVKLIRSLRRRLRLKAISRNRLEDVIQEWRNGFLILHPDSAGLLEVVECICEGTYFESLRAQFIEEHSESEGWFPPDVVKQWIRVSALCWLTLQLCYELHPRFRTADIRLRIEALTLYGKALGYLGRYFEAHRHLNDAHALLSRTDGLVESPDVGIIHLRSAEVHLLEARLLGRFFRALEGAWPTEEDLIDLNDDLKHLEPHLNDLPGGDALNELTRKLRGNKDGALKVFGILVLHVSQGSTRRMEVCEATAWKKRWKTDELREVKETSETRGVRITRERLSEKDRQAAEIIALQYYQIYLHRIRPQEKEADCKSGVMNCIYRQHIAKLDDAWLALEAAEHAFSGKNHSSRWWGYLHALRLLVYVEHKVPDPHSTIRRHQTLAFRNRQDPLQFIESTYIDARVAARGNLDYALRAIDYAWRAAETLQNARSGYYNELRRKEFLWTLQEDFDGLKNDFEELEKTLSDIQSQRETDSDLQPFDGKQILSRYYADIKEQLSRFTRRSSRR